MFGSEKVEISGRRDSANRSAQWDKAIVTHEYFNQQRHLLGAPRDDSDYLEEVRNTICRFFFFLP